MMNHQRVSFQEREYFYLQLHRIGMKLSIIQCNQDKSDP